MTISTAYRLGASRARTTGATEALAFGDAISSKDAWDLLETYGHISLDMMRAYYQGYNDNLLEVQ